MGFIGATYISKVSQHETKIKNKNNDILFVYSLQVLQRKKAD